MLVAAATCACPTCWAESDMLKWKPLLRLHICIGHKGVQPTEVGGRTTVFLCHAGSIERVQSFYWVCNVKNWAHLG